MNVCLARTIHTYKLCTKDKMVSNYGRRHAWWQYTSGFLDSTHSPVPRFVALVLTLSLSSSPVSPFPNPSRCTSSVRPLLPPPLPPSLLFCFPTQAMRTGSIQVGDIIAEIGGQSVRGLPFDRVTAILGILLVALSPFNTHEID